MKLPLTKPRRDALCQAVLWSVVLAGMLADHLEFTRLSRALIYVALAVAVCGYLNTLTTDRRRVRRRRPRVPRLPPPPSGTLGAGRRSDVPSPTDQA